MASNNLKAMKALHITRKKIRCALAETSLMELANLFFKSKRTSIPIVDKKRIVLGVLTEIDILRAFVEGRELHSLTAGQLINVGFITAEKESPVFAAAKSMVDNNIHQIPVLKDGKLVGVLNSKDILGVLSMTKQVDSNIKTIEIDLSE